MAMQYTVASATRPRAAEAQPFAGAQRATPTLATSQSRPFAAGGPAQGMRVPSRTLAVGGTKPAATASRPAQPQVQVDENNPVVIFLKEAGLQMYAKALLTSGFDDLETLAEIEDADMKDLGIHSYHAVRLRRRLQELQRNEPTETELDDNHPVVAFLTEAGLAQYARVLLRNGFDEMDTLVLIDDPDLKELGVPRGHAVKLKRRLREYEIADAAHDDYPAVRPGALGGRRPATAQQVPKPRAIQGAPKAAYGRQTPAGGMKNMPSEQMRSAVEQSWEQVQTLGTYAVGELLYKHTFQLAPEAIGLFPAEVRRKYREWSADEGHEQEEDTDVWESPALRKLFGKVINAVGCTVAGLHDMSKLVPMLTKLGMRHINYGVSDEHWTVLGKALDLTLQDILGASYTQEVQNAWTMVYGFMSSIMIEGLHQAQDLARGGRITNENDDAGSMCSSSLGVLRPSSEACEVTEKMNGDRQISEASTLSTQLEDRSSLSGQGPEPIF